MMMVVVMVAVKPNVSRSNSPPALSYIEISLQSQMGIISLCCISGVKRMGIAPTLVSCAHYNAVLLLNAFACGQESVI